MPNSARDLCFKPTATHYACARCKKKWASGQPSPFCPSCSPSAMSASQEHTDSRDEGTSPLPEWAVAMSQLVSDLTKVSQSLVQVLERLPQLSTATSAPTASQGESSAPDRNLQRDRPSRMSRKRLLSGSSSSSLGPSALPRCLSPSEDDLGSDDDPQSGSSSEADDMSKTQNMVDNLLSAIFQTLEIKQDKPLPQECSVPFKRSRPPFKTFPNHKEFDTTLAKYWEHPEQRFSGCRYLDVLYPFEADLLSKWTKAPEVDPPVSRIASKTVLSLPDGASLKDPADRQLESLAKSIFEASGASLCPIFASSWVAKVISAWAKILRRGILAAAPQDELAELADQINHAGKYLLAGSLDAAGCVARANSNIVAVRRVLWLKSWNADTTSKKSLTNLPFHGSRLFGAKLDQIISDATVGKSTSLPQSRPRRLFNRKGFRPFRPFVRSHPQRDLSSKSALPHLGNESRRNHLTSPLPAADLEDNTPGPQVPVPVGFPPSDGAPPPGSFSRVGGRLSFFVDAWLSVVDDAWVREIIASGYKIEFSSPPDRRFSCLDLQDNGPTFQDSFRPSPPFFPPE
ncbi:uncharacterized protein [Dendrobates tinctorius]|uniref:uncharacterized protein n=1 Tax=Dendrobates tinctorius TaxID=92724 RepID=UPI003CCA17AB